MHPRRWGSESCQFVNRFCGTAAGVTTGVSGRRVGVRQVVRSSRLSAGGGVGRMADRPASTRHADGGRSSITRKSAGRSMVARSDRRRPQKDARRSAGQIGRTPKGGRVEASGYSPTLIHFSQRISAPGARSGVSPTPRIRRERRRRAARTPGARCASCADSLLRAASQSAADTP